MKKSSAVCWVLVLVGIALLGQLEAKRKAPEEVKPLVWNGIKYTAPHFLMSEGKEQNGGYIEAWDVKTNEKLWELKVYDIKYNPKLETDIQDNFIVSIEIDKMKFKLIIKNEHHQVFEVDLKTRKVSKKK